MANTYSQIHLQIVFAVKYRQRCIKENWKIELYKYITGIIQNNGHKLLIINGVSDHVHILIGYRPEQSVSDLVRDVKACSSKWINERRFTNDKFEWQSGYGVFAYHKDMVPTIIKYISNQECHHSSISFRSEYIQLFSEHGVSFDENYIFHAPL